MLTFVLGPVFLLQVVPSIGKQLKPHQIQGVRVLWRNIVTEHEETAAAAAAVATEGNRSDGDDDDDFQDTEEDKAGLAGGCILAHSMGLGKTMQVITLLHTMMVEDRYGGLRV
jgi:transcriptional regulator ATRX